MNLSGQPRKKDSSATRPVFDAWAEYYDLIHKGAPGDVEFYVCQALRGEGKVLELGCGTGRIAIPMAVAGADVVGVDNSKKMLDLCGAKLRRLPLISGALRLELANMESFAVEESFGLAIMSYRTILHLLTVDAALRCFQSVGKHLVSNGVFIVNTWRPRPQDIIRDNNRDDVSLRLVGRYLLTRGGRHLLHYVKTTFTKTTQILHEEHVLHEVDRLGVVRKTSILPMTRRWITPSEITRLAEQCGFEIEGVFGDFECSPFTETSTEGIWLLRKKERNRF